MKHLFPGFYRPTEEEFRHLWAECTFVLDANVLLNIYRYPEEAREDLLNVLTKVADRLWVPHHAALEFQRNRLNVIAEQSKRFDDVRKLLDDAESKLVNGLENLQLKKRHASINPDKFIANVKEALRSFCLDLESMEKRQLHVDNEDNIRERISSLLKGKIGLPPISQQDLDSLHQEGERRFKHSIPPGYSDKGKERSSEGDDFSYGGLIYKKKFGDLILWNQILHEARQKKTKYLVLVTEDTKEDWWWMLDSSGEKVIGPRPELVEEIYREAKTCFYMYDSRRFMEYSEKHLAIKIRAESIEQVKDVNELRKRIFSLEHIQASVEGVINWISEAFPAHTQLVSPIHDADIQIRPSGGETIAFDVKTPTQLTIERIVQFLNARLAQPNTIHMILVLVVPPHMERYVWRFANDIQRVIYGGSENVPYDEIYIGTLDYDLRNQPLFRPAARCGRQGFTDLRSGQEQN